MRALMHALLTWLTAVTDGDNRTALVFEGNRKSSLGEPMLMVWPMVNKPYKVGMQGVWKPVCLSTQVT